jgi:hypothetical protein
MKHQDFSRCPFRFSVSGNKFSCEFQIFLIAQTSLLSYHVHLGFGKHSWDITNWTDYLFVANLAGVCSIIAAAWSKTSFAILLLRFTDGWMRKLVWFVIGSVNLFLGLSALFTYVQCSPIKKLWDFSVPGECWPQQVIITFNSFSSGKWVIQPISSPSRA